MYSQEEILAKIKSIVLEEIPDAKVYLFGSRVTGKVHEESDWDVLAITLKEVNREMKAGVQKKLADRMNDFYYFIDLKIVNEKEWFESPSHYVLRESIKDEALAI
ncbi:MAG: nucleotidyltransferase domain-containing protein [Ginsengibacter sp.]